ncbi:MAG TPA: bifunctional transaldolase/phosoglucose isomerase [Bryobacteraceae bacterium]|nr:bifunctional transaldolase/phosoglucose isomerase [Bryobacteraceae bacterium]
MKESLPPQIAAEVQTAAEDWSRSGKVARLWNRDKTLWTNADEDKWLGWLDIADRQLEQKSVFAAVANQARSGGYRDVVVLGMGGSSLCPEVLSMTFGQQEGFPKLHILDSTDPAEVKAIEDLADPKTTLYIVSSKSGSTLEPNIFKQYFFEKSGGVSGNAGSRFIAVTDPGSKMEQVARSDGFSRICYGVASIGGRYSALSDFGMIPGAAAGLDIPKLLDRAVTMSGQCREPDAAKNPGVSLGLALGTLAKHGHDKITLIASPATFDLGAWLEQLIAESTGKIGRALIPVDREPAGRPEDYGQDRTFVYIRFAPEVDTKQEDAVAQLERAGHPVIRLEVSDRYEIGAEFFRWEIAVAVAGAVIGINPFDQPDVEASKIATRKLTDGYEKTGKLPPESPILEADGMKFFTDARNASQLQGKTAVELLRSHFNRLGAGDYFALLGFIQMNSDHEDALRKMRLSVRDRKRVATCLGFGPRFLHSTGQAYKGGPNSGVFLQVTCDDAEDLPIPGRKFTFGIVKAAQARGDFDVLAERQRRALRVHLPADLKTGLITLGAAITEALS